MKNLFSKKKLVGFILCFLSAIFIQATSVNALGETIPPVYNYSLNDDLFSSTSFLDTDVRNDYLHLYYDLLEHYNNTLSSSYDSYVIRSFVRPTNEGNIDNWYLGKPRLYYFNSENVDSDFLFSNIYNTCHAFRLELKFKNVNTIHFISFDANDNKNYNTANINNGIFEFVSSYFPSSTSGDYKFHFETNLEKNIVFNGGDVNTILFKGEYYNIGDIIFTFDVLDIEPKDNLKGIYNYAGTAPTNLEFVEYNFVVDNLNDNKFTFYLKDHMTKIKTDDLDYFELSYRNLNSDINDPFIFIDSFSINDPFSFIKTRNINFDFIEFYFEGAQYREDLYFLNDLLDRVEFKIKIFPKDNIKIQNLHLLDSFDTYNSSLDYYLIPKSWKINNKNYTYDYFTSGFIQGTVSELDNLKEINLPPGVNKIFLYSNIDTLSTIIGYDFNEKRRLYNYSLSQKNITSTVNSFEILDSFNTKWNNLYKIEKNIYNDDIFYLELLDIHSLGYTLWVSQDVEYKFFIDKTIIIKDETIDNVLNPDRQETIDTDANFSHFKKGFSAVNILYGTFYNNLTSEFKFLHNFLITLMILSVVFWVVML